VKRWRDISSQTCGRIAAVFLAAMLLLTVADVSLRAVFNYPLRGVFDLIELLLAATFFFALPCVFLRDDNIVVLANAGVAVAVSTLGNASAARTLRQLGRPRRDSGLAVNPWD